MNAQNGKKGDTMSKNPIIEGIVFKHGDDDYSFWMPDISKEERKIRTNAVCSLRG